LHFSFILSDDHNWTGINWRQPRKKGDQNLKKVRINEREKTLTGTRDRCYDFLNTFAEKFSIKIGLLTQNKAKFWKKWS
jgi:hypothetical protein